MAAENTTAASSGIPNVKSSEGFQGTVASRSLSRARQFGKDLTNMFSFTRNQSRQSSKPHTNTQHPVISVNNSTNSAGNPMSRQKANTTHTAGSMPRSARHNQHQAPVTYDYNHSHKNTAITNLQLFPNPKSTGVAQTTNIRKSSLNPTTAIQKSLNSLDF